MIMGVFDNVRLPLAVGRKNKFVMNPITTCTQEWFSLRPVFSTELMPGADIRVAQSYFVRLSPLAKPMLGSGRIVNRAFFVPYRTVMPGFEDFIQDNDNNLMNERYSKVPVCSTSTIAQAIQLSGTVTGTIDDYDFALQNPTTSAVTYYKFNQRGKQIYSILTGLGYSLNLSADASSEANVNVSVMKLLCYFRIVADWYVSNNFFYRANVILSKIYEIGKQTTPVTASQLQDLFLNTYYSNIDNDYFSTASLQPVTPSGSSVVNVFDVTNDKTNSSNGLATVLASNGTPTVLSPSTPTLKGSTSSGAASSDTSPRNITQYMVDALAALTSYMQRNNIVGYKTLDRFRARFGVQLSADKLDRSYYLGSNQSALHIDEVLSNADTSGAALGDYVGRGSAGDKDKTFSYKNDGNSFGCFIILSTILPDIHYGQGISRDNLHINRFDFFTPEFDALGMQAIARAELYSDAKTLAQRDRAVSFQPNLTFGFQPTYSEYCRIPDILSGDFRRIKALDLRGFHLYRMFDEDGVEGSPHITDYATISENFVVGNPSEYNKIFNYTENDWDHFYCVHSFNVVLVQPKKKLVDSFEFHDDNEGAPVTMPYKGTKLN